MTRYGKFEKKAYLAVMLLGGVALFVDRFFLTESVTAPKLAEARPRRSPGRSSNAPTTPVSTRPAPGAVPSAAVDHSIPELPFPRNLPRWDAESDLRDVFSPASADNRHGANAREGERGRGASHDFAKSHKLDAVLLQERLRIAVVNGVSIKVGDSVGGCELVEIESRNVRFHCRDGDVALTLSPTETAPNR